MAFTYRVLRSLTPGARPPANVHRFGELYVNSADEQFGLIDENGLPQDLLAITFFKNTANYKEGDHVLFDGKIYIARNDIQGPKNFDPDDWWTSGLDLSIGNYDPETEYQPGDVAFFPDDTIKCFLQALVAIPANTPFDPDMWGPICQGGFNSGLSVGDTLMTMHLLTPDMQLDRRLVILHGQEISRVGEYADLFAEWGTQFGEGNGASTFNVPDMRGVVPRGVDAGLGMDPDADNRYARFPGGGANVGAMGGTLQDDQVGTHKHTFRLDEPANDYVNAPGSQHGYVRNMVFPWHPLQQTYDYVSSETRMKNIGVHWYARY